MGIIANVFRTGKFDLAGTHLWRQSDCTNAGWSSQFSEVCVENASGPFDPEPNRPGVMILRHRTCHSLHAVLTEHVESNVWTMMGGNFLHSTDSRFGELCRDLLQQGTPPLSFGGIHFGYGAVAIHDRIE